MFIWIYINLNTNTNLFDSNSNLILICLDFYSSQCKHKFYLIQNPTQLLFVRTYIHLNTNTKFIWTKLQSNYISISTKTETWFDQISTNSCLLDISFSTQTQILFDSSFNPSFVCLDIYPFECKHKFYWIQTPIQLVFIWIYIHLNTNTNFIWFKFEFNLCLLKLISISIQTQIWNESNLNQNCVYLNEYPSQFKYKFCLEEIDLHPTCIYLNKYLSKFKHKFYLIQIWIQLVFIKINIHLNSNTNLKRFKLESNFCLSK